MMATEPMATGPIAAEPIAAEPMASDASTTIASATTTEAPAAPGDWIAVCRLDDIPVQGARVVRAALLDIAVFRTADDRVFALHDRCPHQGGPLSQGIVYGDRVACPLHNWQIALATGSAQAPDEGCARRIPVDRDGDTIRLPRAVLVADARTAAATALG